MVSLHFIYFISWGVLDIDGPLYGITLWAGPARSIRFDHCRGLGQQKFKQKSHHRISGKFPKTLRALAGNITMYVKQCDCLKHYLCMAR
jgi:hypothetical protein